VVAVHAGEIPRDPDLLRALPGVGEYTAAAVASIAFGSPMAAVDGNVRRVLARLADEAQPSPREVGQWAAALLDRREPGTFNQAMMELGATVCTPRGARCDRCPVARFCGARAAGTVAERPARRSRRPSPETREAVAALVRRERGKVLLLLRKRPDRGLLGGLWELPGTPLGPAVTPRRAARRLALRLAAELPTAGGRTIGAVRPLEPLLHVFTHRRIRYLPHLFLVEGAAKSSAPAPGPSQGVTDGPARTGELRWVEAGGEAGLPLPAAQRSLVERVVRAVVEEDEAVAAPLPDPKARPRARKGG
jgi:A/G-specific adenine glycosylase